MPAMHKKLIESLQSKNSALIASIIQNGIPNKKYGFLEDGFKAAGMFEPYSGGSIFHILASQTSTAHLVSTILNNLTAICMREGTSPTSVIKLLVTPNTSGVTAVELLSTHGPDHLPLVRQAFHKHATQHLPDLFLYDWANVVSSIFQENDAKVILQYINHELRQDLVYTKAAVDHITQSIKDAEATERANGIAQIKNIQDPVIQSTIARLIPSLKNGDLLRNAISYCLNTTEGDVISNMNWLLGEAAEELQTISTLAAAERLAITQAAEEAEELARTQAAELAKVQAAELAKVQAAELARTQAAEEAEELAREELARTQAAEDRDVPLKERSDVNTDPSLIKTEDHAHAAISRPTAGCVAHTPTEEALPKPKKEKKQKLEKATSVQLTPAEHLQKMLELFCFYAEKNKDERVVRLEDQPIKDGVEVKYYEFLKDYGETPCILDFIAGFYGTGLFNYLSNKINKSNKSDTIVQLYINTLTITDLQSSIPKVGVTHYEQSCIKQYDNREKNLSKMLLDRSLEVKALDIPTAISLAARQHNSHIIDYAFSKAGPISEKGWDLILRFAIKYADLNIVTKYAELSKTEDAPMVTILHESTKEPHLKVYDLLNYMLKSLTQLYSTEDFTHSVIESDKLTTAKADALAKSSTLWNILDTLWPLLFLPGTTEEVVAKSIKLLRLVWKTDVERVAANECEKLRIKLLELYKNSPAALEALDTKRVFREVGDGESTVGSIDTHFSALSDIGSPRREREFDCTDVDLVGGSDTESASEVS